MTSPIPSPVPSTTPSSALEQPLDRYIDRFLRAEGWQVTNVDVDAEAGQFAVTITKGKEPGLGQSATRSATSAGEATFKACSTARRLSAQTAEE